MKKLRIAIIIFIAIVIYFAYSSFVTEKNEIIISYLTDESVQLNTLNNMKLDIVYGAPHYSGLKSYTYKDNNFIEAKQYVSSPIGEVNIKYINKIIDLHSDFKTYKDVRLSYGQIAFVKEIDEYVFIIFDGFFNDYEDENYKKNIIFKFNEEDNTFEKEGIVLPKSEFISEFVYYNDKMFFTTIRESYANEKNTHNTIIYELYDNNLKEYLGVTGSYFYDMYSVEDGLYCVYIDTKGNNKVSYINFNNLENRKTIDLDYNIEQSSLVYDKGKEAICIFSKNDKYIKVTEINNHFEISRVYNLEINDFMEIDKVMYFENSLFIIIRENSTSASMYKINNDKLEKIITFELNTKINDLFYYNVFLN